MHYYSSEMVLFGYQHLARCGETIVCLERIEVGTRNDFLTHTVAPIPICGCGACHVETSRFDPKVKCPYKTARRIIYLYDSGTRLTKLERHPRLRVERVGEILCQLRLLWMHITNNHRYPLVSPSDVHDVDLVVMRPRNNVSTVIYHRDIKPIACVYNTIPIEICPN